MKIAIIQFGGTNCDMDVLHVLKDVVGVDAETVWYKDENLTGFDGVVVPGGFSYGDYLRAGAIAARTPIMDSVKKIAAEGKPVLGICNGFQVLTEARLLEGALTTNEYPKFRCHGANLRVETTDTPFTSKFRKGEVIRMPIAHMEGKFFAEEQTLADLDENEQVVFRYVDEKGRATDKANPNGSLENIAGIVNASRNILGLMPHPERASESILGSDDGRRIFESMADYITENF
ncbi:phosphoribosylformylglycinamidine synthase [Methanosarcina sp. 2.H.T.1A.6]|jgi:phosphoribosylformylglycinamidine synthase I|uniref:phosphoribosylformylglycinamidine synthase subunit PurQ n=1 Tax=unclassified Methanosarcina TaxID=2644672 RepID=UPI000622933B|nr:MULTISPECIES: phosphoribosylformylglycinamidine synthase subunit PurQ [unclassified Methanosarcina]KKG15211.1 phosphoribosylformylglycinamidine synthase [Methanosarcina sp. 2.H.T.1A.3]KKG22896.1 phosphoribosylformylglycinamidine synthase [Methanosarcina sp. 2.H.T.1A.6]KKG24374.1 phosphoribosylformylglycinamidine synthase [Methanosarcina sp. 2.H.T.1A.8]KKH48361.1 phosphoribosylformylglycinamidine synthase [Methanosarcina sp. 1.H.A.2.2]